MRERLKQIASRPWQIIATGVIFTVLFAALGVYFAGYAILNRQSLAGNNYNRRQQVYASENVRGRILSSDGEVLAETRTDAAGEEERYYPYGAVFAHSVGYLAHGRAGVEAKANYYLMRSDLSLTKKAGVSGKFAGNDVVTTLRADLQTAADAALGGQKGAVIVTDAKTGAILAMVSKPAFDPNTVADNWESYVADSANTVLLNRVTQGLYPPGSTFKIVTALSYLREHGGDASDYHFTCTGSFTSGGETIRCYHSQVHGELDFAGAFARSCNSAFASMGLSLKRGTFKDTLNDLGFQGSLPFDGEYKISTANIDEDTSDADLLQLAIGQGETLMTPLHLNMVTSAIANEGILMRPYEIAEVKNADGGTVKRFSPSSAGRLISRAEAESLRELMRGVVENGTGTGLKGAGYTAAGKTGSAEFSTLTKDSHAWFTGFAPAEDPEVCITVVIENAGTGGAAAVPAARRVLDAALN